MNLKATTKFLFILAFSGFLSSGYAQTDTASHENIYDDSNPFEIREPDFTTLDSSEIKKIMGTTNLPGTNVICYRSGMQGDTIRIAYALKNKNKWVSIVTPFHDVTYEYQLINIDRKGRPELVVKGTILYEGWPYGEMRSDAILIYRTGPKPKQIFKLFFRCSEFNVGDRNNEGAGGYSFAIERKIIIDSGVMTIGNADSITYDNDEKNEFILGLCHLTAFRSGAYKLVKGEFIKQ